MFSISSLGRSGVCAAALVLSMFSASELSAYDTADDEACLFCHSKISPGLVKQWRKSTHSTSDVGCLSCHGGMTQDGADLFDLPRVPISPWYENVDQLALALGLRRA